MPRKITQECIDLIKEFEGFSEMPYKCPAGYMTIGYGHRIMPGEKFLNGISKQNAEGLLIDDLLSRAAYLEKAAQVWLNDNQFGALLSFMYNIGGHNFRNSTLLKKIRASDFKGAAEQFQRWVYAGNKTKLEGLVRRRAAERELFLKPVTE